MQRIAQTVCRSRLAWGHPRCFTLIELLVVISIIALLIALLLPALGVARETARASTCMSQLKGFGIATALYQNDTEGKFPFNNYTSSGPGRKLLPYMQTLEVFVCPNDDNHRNPATWYYYSGPNRPAGYDGPGLGRFGDPRISYNHNRLLNGLLVPWTNPQLVHPGTPVDQVRSPSKCSMWQDATGDWSGIDFSDPPYDAFGGYGLESIHPNYTDNFAFVDGHVKTLQTIDLVSHGTYGSADKSSGIRYPSMDSCRDYLGYTIDPDGPTGIDLPTTDACLAASSSS